MGLTPSKPSDEQLIQDIRAEGARRDKAIAVFLDDSNLRNWVIRFVRMNGGTREEGEEIFSSACETFEKKIRAGEKKEEGSLKGFLMGIAKMKWLNAMKGIKRKPPVVPYDEKEVMAKEEYQYDPRQTHSDERHNLILEVLRMSPVSPRCMKLMMLTLEGYTDQEIGRQLDMDHVPQNRQKCHESFKKFFFGTPAIFRKLQNED